MLLEGLAINIATMAEIKMPKKNTGITVGKSPKFEAKVMVGNISSKYIQILKYFNIIFLPIILVHTGYNNLGEVTI